VASVCGRSAAVAWCRGRDGVTYSPSLSPVLTSLLGSTRAGWIAVIRMVDLNQMNLDAKGLKTISMGQEETVEDLSRAVD